MSLPYDPTKDDAGVPLDASRPAPSLGEHQHAASSTAVAPIRLDRILPTEIQDNYSDTETSDDSDNNTTGSSRDQDYMGLSSSRESLIKEQSKIIREWATRSSMELATILEDNMQAHLRKEYEPKAEAHREEMAMILREELTPIVYADLCAEMRPTVNSDLRAEQLPLVQQEMEDYSKQRMEDTENACNTQFNNEWEDMEIELKAVWKRRAETRKAEMEENVDRCLIQRWEDGRIRVDEKLDEYRKTMEDKINSDLRSKTEKLHNTEKQAYSDMEVQLEASKREKQSRANSQIIKWKREQRAAFEAEIASERASRLSQIGKSADTPTLAEARPLRREQGATGPGSDSDSGNPLSLDTLSKGEKTPMVDQDENVPEETKSSQEDIEKGRSDVPSDSRTPQTSAVGTKRARESGEETTECTSDKGQSVSINKKHDSSDGSTRPIKRIRQHGSSPSFIVDTKGSSPKIGPSCHRSTNAVLGAKAVVTKALSSSQDSSSNLEAPEQEDSVGTRGMRYFDATQPLTTAIGSTETATASSPGNIVASSTGIAAANSTSIVMSTTKDYQFGQYQTLVDPAVMARAMANTIQSSKLGTTQEKSKKIFSPPAAAADEDEEDEL